MNSTLPATQWHAGILYLMMPVGGVFIMYFSFLSLFNLEKYRHFDIEEGKNDTTEVK
jgi:TRAP-type transport system small permease protein